MDPQNYMELRRQVYNNLRCSENLLHAQKVEDAFKQIRESFETLQKLQCLVEEKREAEFKYDLSLAFQLQTKICRLKEEGMEDETELLFEALELSSDEEMRVNIIKFAVNSILVSEEDVMLLPNSSKSTAEKLISFVGLINSAFTRTMVLIELNNRNVFKAFPELPEVENLSYQQLSQLLSLAGRSRKSDKILRRLLEMDWLCDPSETEQVLAKMLLVCSLAGTEAEETSYSVLARYTQLTTDNTGVEWKHADVVLAISDRIIFQFAGLGEAAYGVLEKWLVGTTSLASRFGKSKDSHFAKHLLSVFLKQGKLREIDQYLASIKGNPAGGIQKVLCLKEIRAGDIQVAAVKLRETLKFGHFLHAEEVESALKCFLPRLMEEKVLGREMVGGVVNHLTEQRFYFSLGVLAVSLQLASRLGETRLNQIARRLYDDPSLGWISGLDTDCSLTGLCWNLAAGASAPLTKHFLLLLAADLLPWSDHDKDQAVLYSLTAGLQALTAANWSDRRMIRTRLEESVEFLEGSQVSGEFRRFLSLVKFKLVQVTQRECKWEPCDILSDLIRTRDKVGLLTLSKMTSEDSRYIDLNLTSLCEALKLEKSVATDREMLAVANLEQISVVPTSSKMWSVTSQVNSIRWTEKSLLAEALKLTWNIWVRVTTNSESEEICSAWFETMSSLHNKATELCDHISCRLDKPTPGLFKKIQRTIHNISLRN